MVPQPLCRHCAALRPLAHDLRETKPHSAASLSPFLSRKPWLHLVAVGPAVVLFLVGILVSPYFFIPAVVALFPETYVLLSSRRKKPNSSPNRITDAQVYALLRNADRGLTAARLAAATNSTLEAAKRKLNQLVIESQIEVAAVENELYYNDAREK